jgi:hypothetical protein
MEKSELIFKVLSNEASKEEVMALKDWILLNDANKNEYEDLKLLWEGSQTTNNNERDYIYYSGLQRIKAAIKKKESKSNLIFNLSMILMVISVLSIIYFLLYSNSKKENKVLLKFNRAPMFQIISDLEMKYNIKIVMPKNLSNCVFTGSLYNDSAEDAILYLAESMNFEYRVVGERVFKLKGAGCTK